MERKQYLKQLKAFIIPTTLTETNLNGSFAYFGFKSK